MKDSETFKKAPALRGAMFQKKVKEKHKFGSAEFASAGFTRRFVQGYCLTVEKYP